MKKEVLSSDLLWMCSRCYTCYALCPQGVKFTDVIEVLRDMAMKEGYVTKDRYKESRELDKFIQGLRCEMINQKIHPDDKKDKKVKEMVEKELKIKWRK